MIGYDIHPTAPVKRNSLGQPLLYRIPILIELAANRTKIDIGQLLKRLEHNSNQVLGIWVNAPLPVGNNTRVAVTPSQQIATRAVFDGCSLTLKDGTDEMMKEFPLRIIEMVNVQGRPLPINTEKLNLTESVLNVPAAATDGAVAEGDVIEIIFEYVKK